MMSIKDLELLDDQEIVEFSHEIEKIMSTVSDDSSFKSLKAPKTETAES